MTVSLSKVAIVIPVHNRRETTLQALHSLEKVDRTGLDLRIFIVDDGSTDGTSDAVQAEFPDVKIIVGDGTLHYAGGTNRGIEAAMSWGTELVIAMNDDAVFHEQFLQRLIATARAFPHSAVGALLLLWSEPHKVFQVGQQWRTFRGGWDMPSDWTAFTVPKEPFEVECLVGNCVLIPAEAIRECGLMDEHKFPHGWGDAQYFARLAKAGWKMVIEPRAYVWCEPNTYPSPLHKMSLGERVRKLLVDERYPLNLKRQFVARWESAPSRAAAAAAFGVYCFRLLLKALGLTAIEKRTSF